MNSKQYLKNTRRNLRAIIIIVLIVMAISLIFSFFQEPRYRAKSSILVSQKANFNLDMYQASQSAERLAVLLAKVIKSSAFQKDVLNSGFPIDKAYFPIKEKDLRKEWANMVDSRVTTDTSIIEISVYHPSEKEARKIANAIIYVFSDKGKKYYNLGDQVNILVIDTPLVSERPVKPNLLLNTILSFFVGLVVSAIYIAWNMGKPEKKEKKRPKKEAPKEKITEEKEKSPADEEVTENNTGGYIGGLKIINR